MEVSRDITICGLFTMGKVFKWLQLIFSFNAHLVLVGMVTIAATVSWVRFPITCKYINTLLDVMEA